MVTYGNISSNDGNADKNERLIKIQLDGDTTVFIEAVVDPDAGPNIQASSDTPTINSESFTNAAETIKKVAGAVFGKLKDIGPDEVELTVGVKLTTSAGVVIAQAGSEGSFQIKCKWKASKDSD